MVFQYVSIFSIQPLQHHGQHTLNYNALNLSQMIIFVVLSYCQTLSFTLINNPFCDLLQKPHQHVSCWHQSNGINQLQWWYIIQKREHGCDQSGAMTTTCCWMPTRHRQSLLSCKAQLASNHPCFSINEAIVTISHLRQVLWATYLVEIF